MIELDMGFFRKARLWIDQLPMISTEADRTEEFVLAANKTEANIARKVAVELTLPKGARIVYGLVGAAYIPSDNNDLKLRIDIVENPLPIVSKEFNNLSETIYAGLSEEYLPGIYNGISDVKEIIKSGTLTFNYFLHTKSGSSINIFQTLTIITVKLLMLQINSKIEIEELISDTLDKK